MPSANSNEWTAQRVRSELPEVTVIGDDGASYAGKVTNQEQNIMSTDYIASLDGFPHYDGHYTGHVEYEDGRKWYTIARDNGDEYQAQDEPQTVVCISGVAHEEARVVDASGAIVYAVSYYPQYYAKAMRQRMTTGA